VVVAVFAFTLSWNEFLYAFVLIQSPARMTAPVGLVSEDRFTLVLVNAQHVHQVPGHKTDVRDCEWLAELLRHGYCEAASYLTVHNVSFGNSFGTERGWSASELR
jgi:hypothetical protein